MTGPREEGHRCLGARLASMPPSGTMEVGRMVRSQRAAGRDVIHLGAGIPTPAPGFLTQPISFDPDCNLLGDPSGEFSLRAAIARRLQQEQGLFYDPEGEIVITAGAKQAVYAALLALINPGDEIATLDPAWVTYAPSISLAGGTPLLYALDRDNNFHLSVDELAQKISPRTRALIVNTPHNPTGRVFTKGELEPLAALALAHDLWIISDESFDKFIYDGHRHISIATFPELKERTIVIKSFSKSYGFIGGRVGYLAGPSEVAVLVRRFNEQVLSCVSPFMQALALRAIEGEPGWTLHLVNSYREKRDTVVAAIRDMPGMRCGVPEGTFYVWASIESLGLTSAEYTRILLDEAGVAVTPGNAFGESGEGYIRFNLAGPLPMIEQGLERIRDYSTREIQ